LLAGNKDVSLAQLEDALNVYNSKWGIYILLIPLFLSGFLCSTLFWIGSNKSKLLVMLQKIIDKVWELNYAFGIYVTPEGWLLQSLLYRLEGNDIKANQTILKAKRHASEYLLVDTEARCLYEMGRFNPNETERKQQLSQALKIFEKEDICDTLFARFTRNLLEDKNFIVGKTGLDDIYPITQEVCTESSTIVLQLPLHYCKKTK